MAIDFEGDLNESLSSDDHGVSVVWDGNTFEGIFNKEYFEEEGSHNAVISSEPMLYITDANAAGMAQEDAITVDGDSYTIGHVEPDGTGMSLVKLIGA